MGRVTSLHWRLILALAAFGPVYALLTIMGWIHGWEGPVSLSIVLIVGVVVALRAPARPLVHGCLAGFLAAVVAIELQALFLPLYFANNPGYAEIEIPFGLPARVATAVLGPLNALIAGILAAVVAVLLWRPVLRLRSAGTGASAPGED